jgi:hypothetical protein
VVLLGRLLLGFVGNELGEGDIERRHLLPNKHMSKTTREQVTYSEPNTKEKPHAEFDLEGVGGVTREAFVGICWQ